MYKYNQYVCVCMCVFFPFLLQNKSSISSEFPLSHYHVSDDAFIYINQLII